jgi:hypothetical protein
MAVFSLIKFFLNILKLSNQFLMGYLSILKKESMLLLLAKVALANQQLQNLFNIFIESRQEIYILALKTQVN